MMRGATSQPGAQQGTRAYQCSSSSVHAVHGVPRWCGSCRSREPWRTRTQASSKGNLSLSDIIAFEADVSTPNSEEPTALPSEPPRPSSPGSKTSSRPKVVRSSKTGKNRMGANWQTASGPLPSTPSWEAPSSAASDQSSTPAWAQGFFGGSGQSGPALQRAAAPEQEASTTLEFMEKTLPMQGFLQLRSQEEELAAAARTVALPPLQSIVELTTAFKPPTRSLDAQVEDSTQTSTTTAAASTLGRQLPDGVGTLADGTTYEKLSGEDFGAGGFWKRWTVLKGSSADGTVTWEECWWEASDWAGLKELGATKKGTSAQGGAWYEEWCEKAYHDPQTIELVVDRTASKWARADGEQGHEWEEKWGERHHALGQVTKWADKWAQEDGNVWHEKWGEDYDGKGGCHKYTDKWAEKPVWGGGKEEWGDKWTETFADGKGFKHGEVWSIGAGGNRYNRWWNEHHMGDRQVRKWGNSNTGEHWDTIEEMDTYYNPVPHFGFALAVRHSPSLLKIPELPRGHKGPRQGTIITYSETNTPTAQATGTSSGASTGRVHNEGSAPEPPEDMDTQFLGQGLAALDMGFGGEEEEKEEVPAQPAASVSAKSGNTASGLSVTTSAGLDVRPAAGSSLDWTEVLRSVRERSGSRSPSPGADSDGAVAQTEGAGGQHSGALSGLSGGGKGKGGRGEAGRASGKGKQAFTWRSGAGHIPSYGVPGGNQTSGASADDASGGEDDTWYTPV